MRAGNRDHDRVLDERGLRDAQTLANRLASRQFDIRQIVCSTAARAKATLEIVGRALQPEAAVEMSEDFYALGHGAYYEAAECFRSAGRLLLVGHNPMIETFVTELCANGAGDALREAKKGVATARWAILDLHLDGAITLGQGYLREILQP